LKYNVFEIPRVVNTISLNYKEFEIKRVGNTTSLKILIWGIKIQNVGERLIRYVL